MLKGEPREPFEMKNETSGDFVFDVECSQIFTKVTSLKEYTHLIIKSPYLFHSFIFVTMFNNTQKELHFYSNYLLLTLQKEITFA